jgi:hypothetical protein
MTEHVSWLMHERCALGELGEAERAAVERHLSGCERCRQRLGLIQADARPMPPLRAPHQARWARWTRWAWIPALAAALGLLWLQQGGRTGPRAKGDDLVLTVVRERDGRVVEDVRSFAAQDRFHVLLTCPPGAEVLDLVVLQGGQSYHPFDVGEPIACGNRVPVPGAFRLSGADPAQICTVDEEGELTSCVLLAAE